MTDASSRSPDKRSAKQLLLTAAKLLIIAAALVFLVAAIIDARNELSDVVNDPDWLMLTLTLGAAVVAMTWIGWVWILILQRLGSPVPAVAGIGAYYVGDAVKYVPGSLWPVLGRGELAVRAGATRGHAYASVFLSLFLNQIVASAAAAAVLSPFALAGDGSRAPLWLLLLLPAGAAALNPAVMTRVIGLAERIGRRAVNVPILSWRRSMSLVAMYLPAWAAVAATNVAAAEVLGVEAPVGELAFATCVSWLAGFLVVPAPSGLGVREAVFAAVLSASVDREDALAIALVARCAFVLADGGGAMVGLLAMRRGRRVPGVSRSHR